MVSLYEAYCAKWHHIALNEDEVGRVAQGLQIREVGTCAVALEPGWNPRKGYFLLYFNGKTIRKS